MRAVPATLLATAGLAAMAIAGCAHPVRFATFDDAKASASGRGVPVLVDFYADWCGPCQRFASAVETDESLREALRRVAFVSVDSEKGDGEALAETYEVSSYPNFVLMNADGRVIDRWAGFGDVDDFLASLDRAAADPTTVEDKFARFEHAPTAELAERLARIASARSAHAEAVRYWREAERLDPATAGSHVFEIFRHTYAGLDKDEFTIDDVRAAADAAFGNDRIDADVRVEVALSMAELAEKRSDPALATPYLAPALALVDANPGTAGGERSRTALRIAKALLVDADPDAAVAIKRASLPEGWRDAPDQLNDFAWWCFEHATNLEEAEALSRRGVELAQPGAQRAMILDTVAEICNLRGDCGEAIELITRAISEDPENPHYSRQLDRFRAELARKEGGSSVL